MKEKWTGNLIGKMHNNEITAKQVADELGICKAYVSHILNGRRNPRGAREKLENAVNSIIEKRGDA